MEKSASLKLCNPTLREQNLNLQSTSSESADNERRDKLHKLQNRYKERVESFKLKLIKVKWQYKTERKSTGNIEQKEC